MVPTLRTERLVLRPLRADDLEPLHSLWSDASSSLVQKRRALSTLEESRTKLEAVLAGTISKGWAIVPDGSATLAGVAGLVRFEAAHRRAEVFYELLPEHRGKGLVGEALERIVKHGFDDLGLHRLEGHADVANTKSIAVLERARFLREGVLKENYLFDGVFYDTVVYARLA